MVLGLVVGVKVKVQLIDVFKLIVSGCFAIILTRMILAQKLGDVDINGSLITTPSFFIGVKRLNHQLLTLGFTDLQSHPKVVIPL